MAIVPFSQLISKTFTGSLGPSSFVVTKEANQRSEHLRMNQGIQLQLVLLILIEPS
jgi:hypothetical protein